MILQIIFETAVVFRWRLVFFFLKIALQSLFYFEKICKNEIIFFWNWRSHSKHMVFLSKIIQKQRTNDRFKYLKMNLKLNWHLINPKCNGDLSFAINQKYNRIFIKFWDRLNNFFDLFSFFSDFVTFIFDQIFVWNCFSLFFFAPGTFRLIEINFNWPSLQFSKKQFSICFWSPLNAHKKNKIK